MCVLTIHESVLVSYFIKLLSGIITCLNSFNNKLLPHIVIVKKMNLFLLTLSSEQTGSIFNSNTNMHYIRIFYCCGENLLNHLFFNSNYNVTRSCIFFEYKYTTGTHVDGNCASKSATLPAIIEVLG